MWYSCMYLMWNKEQDILRWATYICDLSLMTVLFPTELRIGFLEVDYSVLEPDLMVNVTVGIIEGIPEPGLEVTVALSESDGSAVGELLL